MFVVALSRLSIRSNKELVEKLLGLFVEAEQRNPPRSVEGKTSTRLWRKFIHCKHAFNRLGAQD